MPIKEETSSAVATEKKSFLDFCTQNSKKVIIATVIIAGAALAAVGGAWSVYRTYDKNVVAVVAGEKISLSDYKRLLFASTNSGTPEKPTKLDEMIKEPVLDDLIKLNILKKKAANLGIVVTDKELKDKAAESYPAYAFAKDEKVKGAYEFASQITVLEAKVTEKLVTWKEGNFLACRFDRYTQDDYSKKAQEANQLLASQQPYAKEYCTSLLERMKAGGDYKAELDKLKADTTIGDASWKPYYMTLGKEFGKENFNQNNIILGSNLFEKINQLKGKGTYLVEADSYKDADKKDSKVAGMYAVVTLSGNGNDGETLDFENWYKQELKLNNVVKYPERIKL